MNNKSFYLAITVVIVTAWMLRWEVTAGSGTDNLAIIHFKLDRFTGTSYTCFRDACMVDETSD